MTHFSISPHYYPYAYPITIPISIESYGILRDMILISHHMFHHLSHYYTYGNLGIPHFKKHPWLENSRRLCIWRPEKKRITAGES